MRKGVGGMRRIAAILSVTVVALMATSTGAGAVSAPKLVNFSSVGSGTVLNLDLQLPSALGSVLSTAGLGTKIQQTIAFSKSLGQTDVAKAFVPLGLGRGQSMSEQGSLSGLVSTLVGRALPDVTAKLGEGLKTDNIVDTSLGGLIDLGVMKVSAKSALQKAADGLNYVVSDSFSQIAGLKVNLTSVTSQVADLLQPLLDVTDGVDGGTGLIDTINTTLKPVVDKVNETLGTNLNITLPDLADILNRPLLSIGVIETESHTGLSGLARTAEGLTNIAHIRILGTTDDNALISLDSLKSTAKAALGGSAPVAEAVNHIATVKVLGNVIDLNDEALVVAGKEFPLGDALAPLKNLVVGALGLKIEVLKSTKSLSATHAEANAKTLGISLAPLQGTLGLALNLTGPQSQAVVEGSSVLPTKFPAPLPTTGVPTTTYFLVGPALLGLAVLVRRYTLAHN